MASRNRIIYNVEALFTGPVGPHSATGAHLFAVYTGQLAENGGSGLALPTFSSGDSENARAIPLRMESDINDSTYLSGIGAVGIAVDPSEYSIVNAVRQLHRVQEVSHSAEVTKQDINELGRLAAVSRKTIDPPTVSLDFSYYLTDGTNESKIGLNVDGATSAIKNILDNTENEKNYFLLTVEDNNDADRDATSAADFDTNRSQHYVSAVGNGFLSSYSIDVSVGAIPTANVSIEASNVWYQANSSGNSIPAIDQANGTAITGYKYTIPIATGVDPTDSDPMIDAIRPGEVTLDIWYESVANDSQLPWGGAAVNSLNVQSFTLEAPLAREALQRIGNNFPFARETSFPITVTSSVTADVVDFATGNLVDMFCNESDQRNIKVTMKKSCSEEAAMVYTLKDVELDSQSFSTSIGPNKSVDLSFSAQIASAQDTAKGLFISGEKFNTSVW